MVHIGAITANTIEAVVRLSLKLITLTDFCPDFLSKMLIFIAQSHQNLITVESKETGKTE